MFRGARILVAPLDWGLGHAARCIPVVQALVEHGAVPVIGADKGPLALLRNAFPALEHVRIPGMEVRYGSGRSQAWAMVKQLPALLRQVRAEQQLFEKLQRELRFNAVISDQRFGLRSALLPSVLITHQVFPFSPFAQGVARRVNRRHILRFHRCWVPDHAAAPGLAGELSHGPDQPVNARYIGPLSRFNADSQAQGQPFYLVVAVISGPEPQRTLLERAILAQLEKIEGQHLVVLGKPEAGESRYGNTRTVGHLDSETLCGVMKGAGLIVGRTGYTTLMDLDAIGRGALLIPTPGQPEQEYLGLLQRRNSPHQVQEQHRLDIASALRNPPGTFPGHKSDTTLLAAITELSGLIHHRPPPA